MSCTLFIRWMPVILLLSTVVSVTDSCSSNWSRSKPKRIDHSTTTTTTTPPMTEEPSMDPSMTEATEEPFPDEAPDPVPENFESCEHFCFNGGICSHSLGLKERRCKCPWGFSGHRCEIKLLEQTEVAQNIVDAYDHIRFCDEPHKSLFCLNGGICLYHDIVDLYSCECGKNFTGDRCSEKALSQYYGGGVRMKRNDPVRLEVEEIVPLPSDHKAKVRTESKSRRRRSIKKLIKKS